uniref:BTB domain-containing protein n=1 Tax=Meloidogyne enterolobii TaxID=390850 RepID=A0A6V7UPM2_MELEN|nr:unnamed protein product [Meloidogyne enterolobii]
MISDVSTFESITCKIEWKLYNLDKHGNFMLANHFLSSKQFYHPKYPSVIWQLRVFPNTCQPNFPGFYVSLAQLGLQDSRVLKAQFNIYTLDEDGNKIYFCPSTTSIFKFGTESDKYQVFKPQTSGKSNDNLKNGEVYVLGNDSAEVNLNLDFLLLYCEVEFVPYGMKCENEVVDSSSASSSQRSLKMFKEGILTDCVVEIENESINTHKFILAKSSVVFQRMFEQMGMTEAQNGKIKIVDTSPECFKAMLEYFYCGEIDKRTVGKHSEDLFAIAHKYQVNQLMDICENYMAANIAAENLSNRCLFAELYNLSKLSKACVNFLSANKQSFLVSREWKEFKSLNNDLAIRLLESLALNEEKQTEKKQVVNPFGCQNCEHRNLTTRLFASKPVHSGYLSTQQCAGSLPFASPQHINQTPCFGRSVFFVKTAFCLVRVFRQKTSEFL